MKSQKFLMWIGVAMLFSITSCTTSTQDKTKEDEVSSDLPPTNGEETRYNLNSTDTMVMPIDSNKVDTVPPPM